MDGIVMTKGLQVLPPPPDCCQICAVKHDPMEAHNAQSIYYQFRFNAEYGRSPTWNDAIAHCPQGIKNAWLDLLNALGVDPDSTNLTGNLKSQSEVDERLTKGS